MDVISAGPSQDPRSVACGAVDIAASAAAAESVADLAAVLRALRRREARQRGGPELTYRQMANRTGWSIAVIGGYFTGTKLISADRLDTLARLLGAVAQEQGALATARERAVTSRKPETDLDQPAVGAPPAAVPRMLPPGVSRFTGRLDELAFLDGLLAAGTAQTTAVVSAMAGMAGVGKTGLAVHWAHRVADAFPEGQLYVNLRGYAPGEPLSAGEALGVLLTGLGVEPKAIPVPLDDRVALYRRMLSGRRLLVLLDNAGAAEQVRPLLPPALCVAVVTSRDSLPELFAADGMRRLTLDVLPVGEAVALFASLVGTRAAREPDAVHSLVRLCGRLPLALRVVAEQVAFRPHATLAELSGELRAEGLDALGSATDEQVDVPRVFSWSLRWLPPAAARAFRLLGLVPGRDIDTLGLAALLDEDPQEAGRLADRLVRAHLVQPDGHGRFSMHDLLRAFAVDAVRSDVDPADAEAATTRLLEFYLSSATVAVDTQYPYGATLRRRRTTRAAQWTGTIADVGTVRGAAQWLSAERDNLVRACVYAAEHGWPGHAIALASVLRPVFDNGHDLDGLTVYGAALGASLLTSDAGEVAYLYLCSAATNWRLSRCEVAADQALRASQAYVGLDDRDGMILSMLVLGAVRDRQGRFAEAVDCYHRGLELARAGGNRVSEASQLHNLGWIYIHMQDYETAAELCRQALAIYEEVDQPPGIAEARYGIAAAYTELGRYDEALALAEQALVVELEYGHVMKPVEIRTTVGEICRRLGRLGDATEQLVEALASARDIGQPALIALVLNSLGATCHEAADHARARACHEEARRLTAGGDRLEHARALLGLGDASAGLGDTRTARHYWRQAEAEFTDMDLHLADAVRARL